MSTSRMVTVAEARARARKKYDQNFGLWTTRPIEDFGFEIPLHPPTQSAALANQNDTISWVRAWRESGGPHVVWVEKQWASLGTQNVPERLVFAEPAEVAAFAGQSTHWRTILVRMTRLSEVAGRSPQVGSGIAQSDSRTFQPDSRTFQPDSQPVPPQEFQDALRRHARRISDLGNPDFERLCTVLGWLITNPASGYYIRQLPVPGVDTKWVGKHRQLVTDLTTAVTGAPDLGLINPPGLIRVRFLDPGLAPGGVTDLAAPAAQLAALTLTPRVVLVCENLESVVAMPPMHRTVVVHGSGYAVDRLAQIPWLLAAPIVYWGDLDSHGFAILNRLRAYTGQVFPVLMDVETLEAYSDLWVPEPTPHTGTLTHLLPDEQAALARLREFGDVRLEQERLPWPMCVSALLRAAAQVVAGSEQP